MISSDNASRRQKQILVAARTGVVLMLLPFMLAACVTASAPEKQRVPVVSQWFGDADSDGVADRRDGCPETPRGRAVLPIGCARIELRDVSFAPGSVEITPAARAELDLQVAQLRQPQHRRIAIAGHPDRQGSPEYNHDLSLRRAQAVRDYFVQQGIAAERLEVADSGSWAASATGSSIGHKRHRRVVLSALGAPTRQYREPEPKRVFWQSGQAKPVAISTAPPALTAEREDKKRPYWTVVVGSFRVAANAEGLRDSLRQQGYAAAIATSIVNGQEWRRIEVGLQDSRAGAERLRASLKAAGYHNLLVVKLS